MCGYARDKKSMFKRKDNSQRGQSLVEMAITLPVLILILSGLMDLGRIYYTAIALEEAVAEAALYLAINHSCPKDSGGDCSDPNNAYYRASTSGNNEFNLDQAQFNIQYDDPELVSMSALFPDAGSCTTLGCRVLVQVRYDYDFLTPGIEIIANNVSGGNGLILEIQATQIIVFN